MRVFEDGPDVLVVREAPWGFRAILLGSIGALALGLRQTWGETAWFLRVFLSLFIAVLGFVFLKIALNVTVRFDRGAGRIDILRRGPLGAREETYRLRDFLRARVEESKDSDGSTYRLVFVFSDAMPAALDPALRERLEAERRRGSRGLPLNEVPLTRYLTGGDRGPKSAAAAINAWAGLVEPRS